MPSSFDEPSPNFPMYIPGRSRICSRQSSDFILASLYSNTEGDFSDFAIHFPGLINQDNRLKNQLIKLKKCRICTNKAIFKVNRIIPVKSSFTNFHKLFRDKLLRIRW